MLLYSGSWLLPPGGLNSGPQGWVAGVFYPLSHLTSLLGIFTGRWHFRLSSERLPFHVICLQWSSSSHCSPWHWLSKELYTGCISYTGHRARQWRGTASFFQSKWCGVIWFPSGSFPPMVLFIVQPALSSCLYLRVPIPHKSLLQPLRPGHFVCSALN